MKVDKDTASQNPNRVHLELFEANFTEENKCLRLVLLATGTSHRWKDKRTYKIRSEERFDLCTF